MNTTLSEAVDELIEYISVDRIVKEISRDNLSGFIKDWRRKVFRAIDNLVEEAKEGAE